MSEIVKSQTTATTATITKTNDGRYYILVSNPNNGANDKDWAYAKTLEYARQLAEDLIVNFDEVRGYKGEA